MLLGGGGSYPPPGYSGPCLFYQSPQQVNLVIDPGEGCLSRLTLEGVHPCSIDLIYISHEHIDHWAGLPAITVARVVEKCPRLTLYAPHIGDTGEVPYLRFLPSGIREELQIVTLKELAFEDLRLHPFKTSHPVPTYGVIIEDPDSKSRIAYTADTGPVGWNRDLLVGVDILVAEATLPSVVGSEDEVSIGHMSVRSLLELVEYVRPHRAIAFHLSPYSLKELGHMEEAHGKILFGDRIVVEL